MRVLLSFLFIILFAFPVIAEEAANSSDPRAATGGAQTLEDILARQRGETVDNGYRYNFGDPNNAAAMTDNLGTLGGASNSDLWRALRFNKAEVSVSAGGDVAKVLVQDGGMSWYKFRNGPLKFYGSILLLVTIVALAGFYVFRGKIPLDFPKTGRMVIRFNSLERFAHWMLAGSFILLGFTGIFVLIGRTVIAPVLGKEVNSALLVTSKFIHNNVSWAFMIALVMVFFFWVKHNIPNRTDIEWLRKFGGIIGKEHPPAKKFNAGQKLIFWSVILLGGSISVSGLSLLFPFDLPMFAKTFSVLNSLGINSLLGMAPFPEALTAQEEMQFANLWHAIVAFVLMAIIIAHIYIGSIGMEGAYDAMGTGEVDEAWAEQHHSLWLEEIKEEENESLTASGAKPAE